MSRAKMPMADPEQIRAAVQAIEADLNAGRIGPDEAHRRILACGRAVTSRDLWKASAGRAGSPRRSDWADIRRTVIGLVGLLVMVALGIWLVTWLLAQAPTG